MSYTRNFEVRRVSGALLRDGNYKTPVGSSLRLGTIVLPDAAADGFLKQATDAIPRGVGVGVLWFEHIQYQGYDPNLTLSMDLDKAPASAYAQIITGSGVKVVYKNTPAVTLVDGRTRGAVTMWTPTSAALGKYLEWDTATTSLIVSATAANATPGANDLMKITKFDTSTAGAETVEAVLLGV